MSSWLYMQQFHKVSITRIVVLHKHIGTHKVVQLILILICTSNYECGITDTALQMMYE